uniref:Cytochrome P450, family 3, subfamily A, polypeptide 65 n=1 Tax=Petromyzon marinus TaxID=7757 RepID=S4RZ06_PETMA
HSINIYFKGQVLYLLDSKINVSFSYLLWPYRIFKKMGVPGPTPLPLFGTFLHYSKGFRAFDEESFQRYGRVWGIYDGRLPVLMVADTNMLKQILVKDCLEFFTNHRKIGLNELFGEGLSTVDDEQWKRIRNILSPTFSSGKIKQMYPLILRCADVLVKNLHEKCQSGKSVDLKQGNGEWRLETNRVTAYKIFIALVKRPPPPLLLSRSKMININIYNVQRFSLSALFPVFVPLFEYMGLSLFPKKICIFFKNIVQQFKTDISMNYSTKGRVDFLQLMVDAQLSETVQNGANPHSEKYLTDSELEAQAILFLLAGFETTSTAITFVAYCLACNPDVQTKVQQEIDEFLPDDKAPSYEILNEMEYLDMVVSETMRMYPPAARLDRVCKRTTTVDNLVIPKDVVITVSTWVLHYDPQHWEEPNEFRPERFTKEAKEARDPYCYLPFGQGPRNCIGMRFALMSVKIAVCRILQRYSFQMCSETTIPPKLAKGSILQTEKPLLLKVSERKKAD